MKRNANPKKKDEAPKNDEPPKKTETPKQSKSEKEEEVVVSDFILFSLKNNKSRRATSLFYFSYVLTI